MAILLPTESKSLKGRLFHAGVIAVLLLGGVTMVYPFLVMLSGSLRSAVDEADLDLVPDYLVDDEALYRKFLEFKYNGDVNALNRAHQAAFFSFDAVQAPTDRSPVHKGMVTLDPPHFHWALGGIHADKAVPANLRLLRERLIETYNGDLDAFVKEGGTPAATWLNIVMPPPRWFDRRYEPPYGPLLDAYLDLQHSRPFGEWQPVALAGHFLQTMVFPTYGRDPEARERFASDTAQSLFSWDDFELPARVPPSEATAFRGLWREYVDRELNPSFIVVDEHQLDDYRIFLGSAYGDAASLARQWGRPVTDIADLQLPDGRRWLEGQEKQDYLRFLATLDPEDLRIVMPSALNALETARGDWHYTVSRSADLRQQFASRNYINVWDELAGEGRALWNTVVYCALSIVLALLVNPLAAYGLSRFRLRGGYKALLVLMATMAFPPMVTLIPQFILLRNLGLMNTFVALLLPLIANGYLIFLLKGFFDSLPGELYEAARIDGASEGRMFFQIAMALSKPILAVVALQTFTAAYTMFLYALLVAPDRDMWLISVWLFQYQERASSSGVYASVVIASVPTLVLFLLVQRTIMRGIVVPTEK